jgi:predicted RNA-binding protein YlxR (DUF448 family)
METKAPVRTCVVCRRRAPQQKLLRFVFADDELEIDLEKIALGRGAYCHASKECLLKPGSMMSIAFSIRRERRKRSKKSELRQEEDQKVVSLVDKKLIELEQFVKDKTELKRKISKQKIEKRNLLRELSLVLKAKNVENNNREVTRKIRF